MPQYSFRVTPKDGLEDVTIPFASDAAAVKQAGAAFADMVREHCRTEGSGVRSLWVAREDGTILASWEIRVRLEAETSQSKPVLQ
jgi:hypothetical protein